MSLTDRDFITDEELDRQYRLEKLAEENRAYDAAKCENPHVDGSTCMPDWDGFGFVCFNRVVEERLESSTESGTTQNGIDSSGL